MKKINLSKKAKIIISVAIVLLIAIVGASVFFFGKSSVAQYDFTNKKATFENDATKYKNSISDNNGVTLVYNPENAFVAFKSATSKKVYMACDETAARDGNSALINLTLRDKKGNSYVMNSNDNSVAFKTFEITEEKNSLQINFSLFKDKESAKEGFSKNGICAEIPLTFTTENGNLKVYVNCAEINLSKGLYIETISILPGLFSVKNALNGEHFVIPDGSGALVDLSKEVTEDVVISLNTYGTDVSVTAYKEGAYLPCYALADDKETACVIISEGEALSEIKGNRFKNIGEGNVFTEFRLTAVSSVNENDAMKLCEQYDGEIALTFVFRETESNSYTTLALVIRDFLIKKDYLSDTIQYDFGDMPFFVNVIGSENNKGNPLTTFDDAAEIATLLNSKGVRNIALRYSGVSDGGLAGGSVSKTPLLKSLGEAEELKSLCKIASDKRSSVWMDINVFTGGTAVTNINGVVKAPLYADVYPYMAKENVYTAVSDSSILGKNISAAYSFALEYENLNLAVNDASFLLFTDSNRNMNRQEMLGFTREKVNSLSVNSGLMLDKPAVWLMKGSSAVYSVPQSSALEGSGCATTVPLLPMVLHGSVIYGGEPVNATKGGWISVLRAIEYGAVPSFLFTYEECNDLSYGAYATQTAQYYSKIKSLKTVQGMVMTSHEMLMPGVYKTTYGYNKIVYVNYNETVVTVDGLLLSPQDFIMV